jgi:small ligand-binding sensory domain FIST
VLKSVSALTTARDTDEARADVLSRAAKGLDGASADLALIFATAHHASALGPLSSALRERGIARHVMGCTAESVAGENREIEGEPAVAVWAIQLPGSTITPRRITFSDGAFHGWDAPARPDRQPTLIALGDPFSFPSDRFLRTVDDASPGLRVLGGVASGSQTPDGNRLVLDDRVYTDGGVSVELEGPIALRTIVSQGCRPIGRTFVVTRADRNLIRELGGRSALEVLREVFDTLDPDDQERAQQGLHIGRVINEYQDTFNRGDFLIRNVIGADDDGGIAVTDVIRAGTTVQFQVRDAESATEDLRRMLEDERLSRPKATIAGALLFTCNGRGTRLFDVPNHDISEIHRLLGPVPVAGFFAMGEIGPVGGQNFLHGYTASVVLFEEPENASA